MAREASVATSAALPAPAGREQSAAGCSASLVERLDPPGDFNFRHFRLRHMVAELLRTVRPQGLLPGTTIPDLDLVSTQGERLRVRDLRRMPVLLHLVSYT